MYNPASTKAALSIHLFSKRWQLTYQKLCHNYQCTCQTPPKQQTQKRLTRAQKQKTYEATTDFKHLLFRAPRAMGTSEMSNWDLMIFTCFLKLTKGGATASVCIIRCTWTFSLVSNTLECKLRNSGVPYTLSQK